MYFYVTIPPTGARADCPHRRTDSGLRRNGCRFSDPGPPNGRFIELAVCGSMAHTAGIEKPPDVGQVEVGLALAIIFQAA